MSENFNGKFAIAGFGMVTSQKIGISGRSMQVEAARLAIADAGLKREDIGGTIDLRRAGGGGERVWWSDAFPRVMGLPAKFYFCIGRGGALISLGIMAAAKFLELGIADYVVLAGAVSDWSQAQAAKAKSKGRRGMGTMVQKEGYWGKPFGDLQAVSHHSFFASRHMHVYGTKSKDFGAIAVAQRKWAQMNPKAQMYGRTMTIEDHQSSPIFVYPYHLFDMCQVSDGAVAVVLTLADRAKDCAREPILVRGIGFGEAIDHLWWEKKNYTHLAVDTAKKQAFGQAGMELKDIDVAQLYDCFTGEVMFQLEDYGWCKKGEGGAFVEAGHTSPGGDVPVNTSGGLLSAYHYGDLTGLSEAIIQLRGEAGARQVKNARTCLVTGHGGEILSPGMCSIHTTLILGR
jgi:acetyl-CoA acetyltransferase